MLKFKNTLIEIIVTCFFVGKVKFAPGTFGSLVAFPITYYATISTMRSDFRINFPGMGLEELTFLTAIIVILTLILFLFIIGTICSSIYVKTTGKEDPKEVVIDEVVGQMIAITFSSLSVVFVQSSRLNELFSQNTIDFCFLFLMPFVLFRIFDIVKPWPIGWIDKNIHGGFGIMLDDVLAGIFTVVIHYFITFIIIDWLIPRVL